MEGPFGNAKRKTLSSLAPSSETFWNPETRSYRHPITHRIKQARHRATNEYKKSKDTVTPDWNRFILGTGGGLSLGFKRAGFNIATTAELGLIHCATHEFNFPYSTVIP